MEVDLNKIGSILRASREERGISLEEVSNALCLRKSLIQAIESGTRDLLPHEVYVRSYLKDYANLLNIYDQILPELAEKNTEIEQEIPTETSPIILKPVRRFQKIPFLRLSRKAFVYPAIVLVLAGFYMIDRINRGSDSVPPTNIETTASVSTQSQTSADNIVTTEHQTTTALAEGKKLMITCKERTWVSVVIDDAEKKEFMLNAEDMIILNAKDRFDLLIGNAGGVKLILNGKDIEFSGMSGEVKRIKLS
jgi:cytoskeletal protein RodZ